MDLAELTIAEAHKKLKSKKISSKELTLACLKKIEEKNPEINAFVRITKKNALKKAEEIDKKGVFEDILTGIPCALKDVFCEKGIETTACSRILKGFKPPYDATVVKKLRSKGVVFLGHTNTDEFTMGSSTETSCFGPTKNPHDVSRVAGGSSGGSAAAVSSNMCVFALGTDTGGSIRLPASFCGCVGLKVTYGRVSRYGVMSYASSLDSIGHFTKTAEDAVHVLKTTAGWDKKDSTTFLEKLPSYNLKDSIDGIKIGVPKEYFLKGIDSQIEYNVKKSIKILEKNGAKTISVSLPHTKYALASYYIIAPSEASSNLARFDGIRFGPTAENAKDIIDYYKATRTKGFGDEVKRRIMLGTFSLSAGYYDAYYLKAQKVRTLIKRDFYEAFKKADVIITPVSPDPAFKLGEKISDPLKLYLNDIFTVSVNLAGIPGISVPIGKTKNGLPISMQILGPQFEEPRILQTAYVYEKNS